MKLGDTDMDWVKEAPTLASIGKGVPFVVPARYFDHLTDALQARIAVESYRRSEEDEFNVPADYFEQLSDRIEHRIALENIRTLVPSDRFDVPQGYFADLSSKILSRIDESTLETRPLRKLVTSWISYAAAACITVLIGSVIYFNSSTYNFTKQLSEVPDQEIINYLQVHSNMNDTQFIIENLNAEELQQVTPEVSSEELEQYINNTTL